MTVTAFVGLTANSQTLIKTTRGFKNEELKFKTTSVEKDLTGSISCNTAFVAGSTMDLNFTYTPSTTTDEYGAILELTFPTGIVPNSGTDPLMATDFGQPTADLSISGQTCTWTSGALDFGGIVADGSPIDFTVNVTIDGGVSGDQTVNYSVTGDGFNESQPTVVTGTVNVADNNVPFTDAKVIATATNARFDDGSNYFYRVANCELANVPVAARIVNLGNTPLSNFSISYKLDGDAAVTETVPQTIAAGDSLWYEFSTPIATVSEDLHQIRSYASATADVNNDNDTSAYIFFANSLLTDLDNENYTNTFDTDFEKFSVYKTWIGQGGAFGNSTLYTNNGSAGALFFSPNVTSLWPEGVYSTYVFTTCVEVTAGSSYVIKYYRKSNESSDAPVNGETAILTGEEYDVTTLDTIRDFTAITPNAADGAWEKDSVIYVASTDGVRYFSIAGRAETTGTSQAPTKLGNVRVDDIEVYLLSGVGIDENSLNDFVIYPNPSSDIVNVSLKNPNGMISLLSTDGKVIESREVSSNTETFNVGSLKAGVYFIQVGQSVQKLMVK